MEDKKWVQYRLMTFEMVYETVIGCGSYSKRKAVE
jgi:hypothetical protein